MELDGGMKQTTDRTGTLNATSSMLQASSIRTLGVAHGGFATGTWSSWSAPSTASSARDGLELAGGHGRGRAGQVLDEMSIRMES